MSAADSNKWICLGCQRPVAGPTAPNQKLLCPNCGSDQIVSVETPLGREALSRGAIGSPTKPGGSNPAIRIVAVLALGVIIWLIVKSAGTRPAPPAVESKPAVPAKPVEVKSSTGGKTVEEIVQEGKDAAFLAHQQRASNGDLQAQYRLGLDYRDGIGTETNLALARQWLKKAASEGHYDAVVALKQLNNPKPPAK